ncbi:hypothetical protein SAMN04487773_0914 [Enterobacter sp. kpr-6]|uniref:hypothetical protein n=1 Tax=Enterobacter sp. kpr-6 TaxID=1761782 RepID=UPI0008ECD406|nr:hypothetical protein [Enterobacter sp. kpr-6]SFQ99081.1 hypothetical protein SAMN04487773_0914 [Enterobacter sp. kpr-6]
MSDNKKKSTGKDQGCQRSKDSKISRRDYVKDSEQDIMRQFDTDSDVPPSKKLFESDDKPAKK